MNTSLTEPKVLNGDMGVTVPRCASSQQTSVIAAADRNDRIDEVTDQISAAVADTAPLLLENHTESNDDSTDDEYLDVPSTQTRCIPSVNVATNTLCIPGNNVGTMTDN